MNRQRLYWRRSPFFLLVCPKNLKECIDWVLRATERDIGTKDNIENLKNALEAELKDFDDNSNDLNQLVHGLCLFMGYPSCLCKPKKSVEKSLEKISGELLKEDLKNYKCLLNSDLNCNSSCSDSHVVCKCCVLDCIRAVQSCQCVKGGSKNCSCSNDGTQRCCKDLLEKLKASLSLLNLKADMESLCTCPENCCDDGECKGSSQCNHCSKLKTSKDYTVTGLGLLRPSPKRLAERLEGFFGSSGKPKGSCGCKCGTTGKSCCCLACDKDQCVKACSCNNSGCSCDKAPKDCPRQKFCIAIDGIKIAAEAGVRTCCDSGHKCHCEIDTPNCQATSGLGCCIENSNGHYYHSVKCLIRRLVTYFKELKSDTSNKGCFKNCCELLCVIKTCEFLDGYLSKNEGGKGKVFNDELSKLRFAGPCGQELWRTLDSFLNFICYVFLPKVKPLEYTIKEARDKCPQCKTGHSDCSGCSSGSSSCPGCTAVLDKLKDHKDVLSLMTQGYVSSYDPDKASWSSLTSSGSGSKCCSNSLCSQCQTCSSSGSLCPDPSKCCPDCPQRKAAKIFLGMLPCLYWGLKIVFDRCKYGSGFAGWHDISVSNGNPSSDLAKFLYAWGYDLDPLKSKKGFEFSCMFGNLFGSDSSGPLQKLSTLVTENYFTSNLISPPKDPKTPPKTVRELLLWLYGLRFQKHFSDLVENCKSLCLPFGNSYNADAFCYYIHTCCFILPVAIISFIETSDSNATKFFSSAYSEFSKFFYPSDPSALADMFFDYIRKVYIALNFLRYQCERITEHGGWQDCAFGKGCVKGLQENPAPVTSPSECCPSSLPKGILCTSVPGVSNYHEHCTSSNPKVKCIGLQKCNQSTSGSAATDAHTSGGTKCDPSCPHPLLMFLIDGSESKSQALQNFRTPFHLPGIVPMGFSPDNLISPGRSGESLHDVLKPFCTNGFYPLTRLLKFLARISLHPPETLGEFFLFFKKLAEALDSGPLKDSFPQYVDGEPGFYSGSALKKALEDLYGSSHSSSSHTPASLYSLSSCHANIASKANCGAYLHPLAQDASDNFVEDLVDTYLSWICYLPKDFKTLLEEFRGKFSSCCSTGSSSPCKSIIYCPCALATLYSQGFTFMSPGGLGCWNSWEEHKARGGVQEHTDENSPHCTRRTCKNFIDQLGKVLQVDAPLHLLINAIEAFLWSIREPFFLFILAFWAFVISYFLYVQLYKLDLLHLKSHAHFSRSIKILPSTLFSDASSKLKDLSYFSL